jgi:peroxiredoxin
VVEVYPQIREAGAEVIAVSFSAPKFVAHFVQKYPLPFPAVSDPEGEAYRAFALGKTGWLDFLRPAVICGYLRLMFRGWLPGKMRRDDDLLQLGGDFVLDGERRVIYAYRSADATDRPGVEELVAAVKKAGHGN